jgi:DNA-binding transcriptional LysR family regulator
MILARQIEAFRAVMQTGAMTTAAGMIHVTQPAVSRLIRSLEEELGFALFTRRGNLVTPTAQAHELLREVDRAFVGLDHIRSFAAELRAGRGGLLTVAAMPAMSAGFLPRFVARFLRTRPGLPIVVEGLPSSLVIEGVVGGRIDIGIVTAPFQRQRLSITNLSDAAVVVLRPEHRLAARPSIRAGDLEGEQVIVLTKFTNGRHPIEFALQSVRIGRKVETPLATIACVLVQEGVGVAIVDPFSASEFVGPRLVSRRFEPPSAVGTAVIHSSERSLSGVAQEFHAEMVAAAQSFLAETHVRLD